MIKQLYLFKEYENPIFVFINESGVDISTISPLNFLSKDPSKASKQRRRRTNKMKILSSFSKGKYIAFPTGGEHPSPKYEKLGKVFPFVYNSDIDREVSTRTTRNIYPCLSFGLGPAGQVLNGGTAHTIDFTAHELFAMAFLDNEHPDKYWLIDHINEDKLDYRIKNLTWISQSENQKKAFRLKKNKENIECDYII